MLQNLVSRFMSKADFKYIGISKENFIRPIDSTGKLNMSKNTEKISCRCLILCGSEDKINMKSVYSFHDHIKDSTLKIIPESAHEVNTDNQRELSSVIAEFWRNAL